MTSTYSTHSGPGPNTFPRPRPAAKEFLVALPALGPASDDDGSGADDLLDADRLEQLDDGVDLGRAPR